MDPYNTQDMAGRRKGLKKKILLSIFVAGILPLVMGQMMAFYKGREEILQVNGANFQAIAQQTARTLDLLLLEEEAQAQRMAAEPTIIHALEVRRDQLALLEPSDHDSFFREEKELWEKRDSAFVAKVTQGPVPAILYQYYLRAFQNAGRTTASLPRSSTRALFVTDREGRLVASLNTAVGYGHGQSEWWKAAFHRGVGKSYFGKVTFDRALNTHTFTLSVPVLDSIQYQAIGVLHRVYDAAEFFGPSMKTLTFGNTGHVMLIDSQGTVIYCPVLKTGTHLRSLDVLSGIVSTPSSGWLPTTNDGHHGARASIVGFASLPGVNRSTKAASQPSWHTFVWQHPDEVFAPVQQLQLWNGLFGVIAMTLLIILGAMAAERIVMPIRRLKDAARLIGRGELKEPLHIQTDDEIEELAEEVNRMNQQLLEAMGGLRSEVESKTRAMVGLQESTSQILNKVPTPVILLDAQEHVTYLNQAGREALGWESHTLDHIKLFDLLPVSGSLRETLRTQFLMKSGSLAEKAASYSSETNNAKVSLRDPLSPENTQAGNTQKQMIEIRGRRYWYEWFCINPTAEGSGDVGLVLRDLTEEHRIQDQVAYNEKLSSLGILSSGIGHELNNPLVGVIGLGEAIQEEETLEQAKSFAKEIVHHGQRMATVIRNFTGQVQGKVQGQLLNVFVDEELSKAWDLVKESYEAAAITVGTSYQCSAPIRAQPEEIRQIFVNVLTNAVQAMNGKGSLFFSTHCSDETITVSILDSGPGIPKAYMSKIFDPFFTTKQQGEGAGLGLTIARRIITRYHGAIQMKSDEGQGTLCLISFPTCGKVTTKEDHHENVANT